MSVLTGTSEMSKLTQHRIDEVIASCNHDARGAIKALLLVNERLEAEVQLLYDLLLASPSLQPGLPN